MKQYILLSLVVLKGWALTCSHPTDISEVLLFRGIGTAIREDGEAMLVWVNADADQEKLCFCTNESTQWSDPSALSITKTKGSVYFNDLKCCIDPKGVIRIFWNERGESFDKEVFILEKFDSTFEKPRVLWKGNSFKYKYDIDSVGNVAIFQNVNGGVEVREIGIDSAEESTLLPEFRSLDDIWFSEYHRSPDISTVYERWEDENRPHEWALAVSVSSSDGTSSEPVVISDFTRCSMRYKVSVDDENNILIVWIDEGSHVLYAAYKPFEKPWTPFVEITRISEGLSGYSLPFELTYSSGQFVLVWQQEQNRRYFSVYGATFSAKNQEWSDLQQLSPFGENSYFQSLSLNTKGKGIIAWLTEKPSESKTFLQASTLEISKEKK